MSWGHARVVVFFVLALLFVGRAAHAQTDADGGAPTTRPSLVPDTSPTTAPSATTSLLPTPPPPVHARTDVAHTDDTKPPVARSGEDVPANPNEVFSEDWWGKTRPVLEIHGYFRTRAELLHNFSLGRHDNPGTLFPQPIDNSYQDSSGNNQFVSLCGSNGSTPCKDQTQSTANMRFRINPELHISDNLRIMAQIDAFDNMVLGSTPDSYALQPYNGTVNAGQHQSGYQTAGYNTFAPIGAFTTTQGPPTSGINSLSNSVNFQRAWAEYMTPVGQLRFGRMPSQWGLGILANGGEGASPGAPGIDQDYQTNVDRIMFVTGIKSLDLYFAGMWDFVNTGPTNSTPFDVYGGQPVNTCNTCNVNEWGLVIAHRTNPELQKLKLARGDFVINGGLFTIWRNQYLDAVSPETPLTINQNNSQNSPPLNSSLVQRNAWALIPDLWLQILYKKFRLEAEGVAILGEISAIPGSSYNQFQQTDVRMWGMAAQAEFKALEDKLHLQFDFGYASGDQWAQNPLGTSGLNPELNGNAITTFSFHPAYTIDLIFFRKILTRVEGAYYFRPEIDYDFVRNPNGQRFGGGAALIWSRASEFYQTPGHQPDLGVELDLQLYYQAKDGSLNDDPSKIGGFYTMLQYGVFFPLGGLGYLPYQQQAVPNITGGWDLSAAQTVRWFVGVVY